MEKQTTPNIVHVDTWYKEKVSSRSKKELKDSEKKRYKALEDSIVNKKNK